VLLGYYAVFSGNIPTRHLGTIGPILKGQYVQEFYFSWSSWLLKTGPIGFHHYSLPTFWDNISFPSSGVKKSKSFWNYSWIFWPLKMGRIGCPETSVMSYHNTLCNIREERRSHLLRGGGPKLPHCWEISSRCRPSRNGISKVPITALSQRSESDFIIHAVSLWLALNDGFSRERIVWTIYPVLLSTSWHHIFKSGLCMLLKIQADCKSNFALTFAKFLSPNYNFASKQNTQCSYNATFWRISGNVVAVDLQQYVPFVLLRFPLHRSLPTKYFVLLSLI
jgi:hypothetical protein